MAAVVLLSAVFTGCKKDDGDDFGDTKTYALKTKDVLGITGTATFTQTSATDTRIDLVVTGAPSGTHPAHIHFSSAAETGAIAITLNDVDAQGKSTTVVRQRDDGTAITYAQLLEFDGYINVHESAANLGVIYAQGDIGGNELTGDNKSYTLDTVGTSPVSGTVKFEKRKNGYSLVSIDVDNTLPSGDHPTHIHLGSIATIGGGPIKITLNNVNGASGKSITTVRKLDDGTAITYDNLLVFDGYLNIHESLLNIGNVICHGNIGSN